jgi:hypothetical protein
MADNLPPTPVQPEGTAVAESKPGALSRLRQWLGDSYNGLFKIVIQPQLPSLRLTGFMVLAFLFGMIWAYAIAPTTYYNGSFDQLSESNRALYVKLVAATYQEDIFGTTPENELSIFRGLLGAVENPGGAIDGLIEQEGNTNLRQKLQQIKPIADGVEGIDAPAPGSILGDILTFVVAVVVLLVIMNVFALLWGLLIGGYVMRFWERIRPKSEEDIERNRAAKKMIEDIKRRKVLEEEMHSAPQAPDVQLGPPLTQRISTYAKGRAYDDSFAIEDANDMFLGECGATIAKTISDSQELTAVEIWLFDKDDFVRTFTKLFVSRHAYNDAVMRAELEPKVEDPQTDLVTLEPGATIVLESKKIRVQAKVAEATPGMTAGLPPDSHFSALTLQIQAWERKGDAVAAAPPVPVAAASGQRPLDEYEVGPPPAMPSSMAAPPPSASSGQRPLDEYEIGTPPPMPSGMTPPPAAPSPTSSGQRPLDAYEIGPPPPMPSGMTPPPAAQPPGGMPGQPPFPQDDDDPFDGSGDFTPIPRN